MRWKTCKKCHVNYAATTAAFNPKKRGHGGEPWAGSVVDPDSLEDTCKRCSTPTAVRPQIRKENQ